MCRSRTSTFCVDHTYLKDENPEAFDKLEKSVRDEPTVAEQQFFLQMVSKKVASTKAGITTYDLTPGPHREAAIARVRHDMQLDGMLSVPRADGQLDLGPLPNITGRMDRKTKLYNINGVEKPAIEWAEHIGISRTSFYNRWSRFEGDPERIFEPKKFRKKHRKARLYTFEGESHTAKEWAEIIGIEVAAFYSRIHAAGGVMNKQCLRPRSSR